MKNADYDWEKFSSDDYFFHNYNEIRGDDIVIAGMLGEHCENFGPFDRYLDVGTGTNLMPFLVCSPYCRQSTLMDHATSNCNWLKNRITKENYSDHWRAAIPELVPSKLQSTPHIVQRSLFDLPTEQCDLATMFFCIESITRDQKEFELGIRRFVASLNDGGSYFVALMKNSEGYSVGKISFPALPVDEMLVEQVFSRYSHNVTVQTVEPQTPLIRDGYDGFIVVTGRQ